MKNAIIVVLILLLAAASYHLWRLKKNGHQPNSVVEDNYFEDIPQTIAEAHAGMQEAFVTHSR